MSGRKGMSALMLVALCVFLAGVFVVNGGFKGESDEVGDSGVVDRDEVRMMFMRNFYRFTHEQKLQKDVTVTPEEIEGLFRQSGETVEVVLRKRVTDAFVFSGFLVPRGYERSNECVSSRFIVVLDNNYFSDSEIRRITGVKSDGFSIGNEGNVTTYYPFETSCDVRTKFSGEIFYHEQNNFRNKLLRLMPDVPPGV